MKGQFQYIVLAGLILCAWLHFFSQNTGPAISFRAVEPLKEYAKPSKHDGMAQTISQEIQRTKDPSTGTVPVERLLAIPEFQKQRFSEYQLMGVFTAVPGINWIERGPDNIGGRTRSILYDANDLTGRKVWAGGVGGGLWVCGDITAATPVWTKVDDQFDNLAITCIAQDPLNSNILYFGTGEGRFNFDAIRGFGIYKSIDGGVSWIPLSSTVNNAVFHYVQKIKISGNALLAATRTGGVQRSTNGGLSWTPVLALNIGAPTSRAADLEVSGDYVYASMGIFTRGGIYRSNNNGLNWDLIYSSNFDEARIELAVSRNTDSIVYALLHNANTDGIKSILRSNNATHDPADVIWTILPNPDWCDAGSPSIDFTRGQAFYDLIAVVDPLDTNTVYVGGIDIHKSVDGGNTWAQITQWAPAVCPSITYVHADIHDIVFKPGGAGSGQTSEFLVACDGGIFRTTTAGAAFTNRNKSYNVTQYYSCAMHPTLPNYFLAGSQDNGSQRFLSAGINAAQTITGGDGGFCHIDADEPNIQITTYTGNNFNVSTDGFANFTSYRFSGGSFINPFDYDDVSNIIYSGFSEGEFLRWARPDTAGPAFSFEIPDFDSALVTAVTVSAHTPNRVFFGLDNGSVVMIDNANENLVTSSIVKPAGSPEGSVSCIAIDPLDENHMLVTYFNYGVQSVWESNNATAPFPLWVDVEGLLPDMPVRWALFDPRNSAWALLATEQGVWSTTNLNGNSTDWDPTNNDFANVRVDMLQYRSSDLTLLAATHGRGMFSSALQAVPITLFDFRGELQNKQVMLRWKTSFEQNSYSFEIERSTKLEGKFTKIGSITAAGNSNRTLNYSFRDQQPTGTVNYYRLKQVDLDGSFEFSKVIAIRMSLDILPVVQLVGNPVTTHIDLLFGDIPNSTGTITLVDMTGKKVAYWTRVFQKGTQIRLPLKGIATGAYVLQITVAEQRHSVRVLKR
jgi:trimeric autotransporter adhesin